ncbi:sensor histidine kinase [Paenibacillus pinihumi]|uniref:sensor histidine kinase n=1 Tax=Paenibacillus pinihumi TaxID=669462 RepID=UPI000406F664|nr:HAMP domain-containing sensor histidine kinase [Paenibacillus pinihumi]
MLKKISIRLRLTLVIVAVLTICCVILTLTLNISAVKFTHRLPSPIESSVLNTNSSDYMKQTEMILTGRMPSHETAWQIYHKESILYMLLTIIGGGIFAYIATGHALKPLNDLNEQVINRTVHNLSETMPVPPANDEIAGLTASFNTMTDRLNEAFLMQQRFSANAAHELRTPLTVLRTKLDVFRKKSTHPIDEYNALLATIEKQTSRLSGIVHNLLELTNIPENFDKEAFDLIDTLQDIVEELSPIAAEKKLSLQLLSDESRVLGNRDLLYHAFYNLVENAIKYNFQNGHVLIRSWSDPTQTTIQIVDTGIGIPEKFKKNIFEPFYRVDNSRSRNLGGAGLGLSIVKTIINMHDGEIHLTDNKGGGCCFEVTLKKN